MPGYTNPQNLNRYSYVLNNPIRFTDPTGHKACDEELGCAIHMTDNGGAGIDCDSACQKKYSVVNKIRRKFNNVRIKDPRAWQPDDLNEIYAGLNNIMGKNGFNGNMDAFNTVFGSVTFAVHHFSGTQGGDSDWDRQTGDGIIQIDTNPGKSDWTTVVHEMGHLFSWTYKRKLKNDGLLSYAQTYPNIFTAGAGATGYARYTHSPGEDFADSFLAVIEYGPKQVTGRGVDQPRLNIMTALIQSYTTPHLPGGR